MVCCYWRFSEWLVAVYNGRLDTWLAVDMEREDTYLILLSNSDMQFEYDRVSYVMFAKEKDG